MYCTAKLLFDLMLSDDAHFHMSHSSYGHNALLVRQTVFIVLDTCQVPHVPMSFETAMSVCLLGVNDGITSKHNVKRK